ncbi:MAG: ABC transporter ATP-binding protein [Verrucomicrobiae bacterium]|nr:ABC transporter ATP-binding protein [Verrucomicrobiae bacterium]
MPDPSIILDRVTKAYRLYSSPFDRVKEVFLFFRPPRHKVFKALDEVSLVVNRGEFLGIIGQNGSGKSTLLKLVTGVANPTSGTVSVYGRISALLELGAGFNPEMTGIENIYFAGTFMGRSKFEIDKSLDEIIDFADIGDYIYQPVKLYSSGMYVRLAFSLAINVDPEILVVDEALAVGDIRFQQKCLRKICSFCESGKTIILVSHDLSAVKNFCDRVVWVENGKIMESGSPYEVSKNYISYMKYGDISKDISNNYAPQENGLDRIDWKETSNFESFGNLNAVITGIYAWDKTNNRRPNILVGGEDIELFVKVKAFEDINQPILGFYLTDKNGLIVFAFNTDMENIDLKNFKKNNIYILYAKFKFPHILNGIYQLSFAVANGYGGPESHTPNHWIYDAEIFKVDNDNMQQKKGGIIRILVEDMKILDD